jgi:flagellar assembly factor FliW
MCQRRMPVTETRLFGALEYEESLVVRFPSGLPGFEQETRFVLLERPEWTPLVLLQSLHRAQLCFLAAPVAVIDPSYCLSVTREDLERLGLNEEQQPVPGEQMLCLALLCAPENGPLTGNLLAPVVVNLRTRMAVQAVRTDARYSHQHIFAGEPACS